MPRHGGKHYVLVRGAEEAMTHFKMEIAQDLGLASKLQEGENMFGQMTTTEVGQIGGEMVRRIQAAGEYAIKQRYDNHEARLMPEEILPNPQLVRNISNNGHEMPDVK